MKQQFAIKRADLKSCPTCPQYATCREPCQEVELYLTHDEITSTREYLK